MPADPNRARDMFLAALELPSDDRPAYLAEAWVGMPTCGPRSIDCWPRTPTPTASSNPNPERSPPCSVPAIPGPTYSRQNSATQAFEPDAPTPDGDCDRGAPARSGDADASRSRCRHGRGIGVPPPASARVPTGEGIGTVIAGRYMLVEVIGEGGMGSVYLAEQTEPVKRQVALKLIKTGMDSRGVLARFDAERQALALMDHPNIARIYDGGLTPAGQPFFVMELVKGVPLTEYCDQERLTVKARLELFVAVCQAVQHAHQKGIIHRDLKPGNVLVTEVDGRPTPKVIDFGVAKATEQKLTDMSLPDIGAIVGTPTYMSPEQADPSSMDIDTRTDVYALGVMLYELLDRLAADRRQAVPAGRDPGNAADGARGRSAAPEHQAEHGRSPAEHRRQSEHRASPAGETVARRARLGGDEGAGEGPHPALRDGERIRPRHPALSCRRGRRGPPAEPRLPLEEIRQAEQGASDRGEPGVPDVGRRDRGHSLGHVAANRPVAEGGAGRWRTKCQDRRPAGAMRKPNRRAARPARPGHCFRNQGPQ